MQRLFGDETTGHRIQVLPRNKGVRKEACKEDRDD
jgi:hypothetical protein